MGACQFENIKSTYPEIAAWLEQDSDVFIWMNTSDVIIS